MTYLAIDPEFQDKIPPLSSDEFFKLEENILADGEVREPLVVWNNIIIDGHHRWQIIQKHPHIPYTVKQMDFADRWAAIVWMCRNQLGRRNITPQQRDYLIAQEYEAQSKTHGGDRETERDADGRFTASDEKHHLPKTREIVAKAHDITQHVVQKAVEFGRGLDEAEKASPGIKDAILTGAVKAPKSLISEIRNIPEEKRTETVEAIKEGKIVNLTDVRRANQDKEFRQIERDFGNLKLFRKAVSFAGLYQITDEVLDSVVEADSDLPTTIQDLNDLIGTVATIRDKLITKGANHGKRKPGRA